MIKCLRIDAAYNGKSFTEVRKYELQGDRWVKIGEAFCMDDGWQGSYIVTKYHLNLLLWDRQCFPVNIGIGFGRAVMSVIEEYEADTFINGQTGDVWYGLETEAHGEGETAV